jgi:hypothetical protein
LFPAASKDPTFIEEEFKARPFYCLLAVRLGDLKDFDNPTELDPLRFGVFY